MGTIIFVLIVFSQNYYIIKCTPHRRERTDPIETSEAGCFVRGRRHQQVHGQQGVHEDPSPGHQWHDAQ